MIRVSWRWWWRARVEHTPYVARPRGEPRARGTRDPHTSASN